MAEMAKSEVQAIRQRYEMALLNKNNTSTQVEIIKLLAAAYGIKPSWIFKIIKGELGGNTGANLKLLRLINNLTQQEVANATGLNCGTISGAERNENNPQRKSLLKLAEFYGLTLEDITN